MEDYVQANTNGQLHDAREPSLSPLDRSFLYGDSVYEVVRTYDGILFAYQEHFERMERSATALGLQLPFTDSVLLTEIRRTVSGFRQRQPATSGEDLYVRIQVSRGCGDIGLDVSLAEETSFVILVKALQADDGAKEKKSRGWALTVARTLQRNSVHSLNPAWKTGNYLNNLLALREARGRRKKDVLLTNSEGFLTEASTSNVFFIKDRELITPRLEDGILAGVTRKILLEQASNAWDIGVVERGVRVDELSSFDECFLSCTTRDIVPVGSIDEIRYRCGVRSLSQRLKKMFRQYVEDYNRKNPMLTIC